MYNYSASTFPLRVCALRRFAVRFHRNTQSILLQGMEEARGRGILAGMEMKEEGKNRIRI